MPLKNTVASFISNTGLGRGIRSPLVGTAFSQTHQFLKGNNPSYSNAFEAASQTCSNIRTAINAVRIGKAGAAAVTGLLDNGEHSPTNSNHNVLPYLSSSTITPLGKNDAIYHKTRVHVGRKTSSRIKSIAAGPFVEKAEKMTSSSLSDYQAHKARKNLTFKSGFNQKGFTFLLEDHYFSVEDFYKMFEVKKRFADQLENNDDGVKDIFGCVYKIHNQLKLKNRHSNCTCHIKIHLLKILDVRTNVRSLIQEITHNSTQVLSNSRGRLPKKFQYTDPKVYDDNKINLSFLTSLSCRLSQSTKFKERAKIVKSWQSTLPPASIWEFNLTTHLGKGIHLNTINDLYLDEANYQAAIIDKFTEQIKSLKDIKKLRGSQQTLDSLRSSLDSLVVRRGNEHPTAYVLVLEYVGDRRASILRKKDKDIFSGYSDCCIGMEFESSIKYLLNQEDDEPLVYKTIQQDKDFESGSDLAELFCPSREVTFNVSPEKIGPDSKQPYLMLYDQVLGPDTPSFMEDLRKTFKDFGLDPKSATPDDANFDYYGPDTPPPPLEEEEQNQEKE